jgi:hypothetical protein
VSTKHFDFLIEKGHPIGEVIGVDRYLVRLRGMHPVNQHSLI